MAEYYEMTLTHSLILVFQFAMIVILGTIVLVKWAIILTRLIWQLWARKRTP